MVKLYILLLKFKTRLGLHYLELTYFIQFYHHQYYIEDENTTPLRIHDPKKQYN